MRSSDAYNNDKPRPGEPGRLQDAVRVITAAFRTHVHHCSCVAGAGGSLLCLPVLPRPEPPPRLRSSPPPSSPSKLPAIPGQGGQGQEQSGSRSTPEKAKGAPTMTAPTMAAPTANTHTHTAYCMRTSAKPVTQRFITESPLQQLGGARELSSTLRYKRPPPPEEGQTTKADGAPSLVCEFSFVSIRCNSDPMVC
jgi:hypothetical protein